jgi:Flp pilus assembly protein TadD
VRFIQQMDDEAAALAASRWLAGHYPRHRDAQTLHALLAEAKGQNAEALSAARRALALDPNERQARSVIERAGARRP